MTALHHGDPFDEVGAAPVAKEALRQMYTASNFRSADATSPLSVGWPAAVGVTEVSRLARAVKRSEPQILAFFVTGRTNARSEAANLITEKPRRITHGMRNFDNYAPAVASGVERNIFINCTNQGPSTTPHRVEPMITTTSPTGRTRRGRRFRGVPASSRSAQYRRSSSGVSFVAVVEHSNDVETPARVGRCSGQ